MVSATTGALKASPQAGCLCGVFHLGPNGLAHARWRSCLLPRGLKGGSPVRRAEPLRSAFLGANSPA